MATTDTKVTAAERKQYLKTLEKNLTQRLAELEEANLYDHTAFDKGWTIGRMDMCREVLSSLKYYTQ